jgi:hypothetical protein
MGKDATPRLGDFEGQGLAVETTCRCGHKRIIPPRFLLKLYGPEARLYQFLLGARRGPGARRAKERGDAVSGRFG